jgi:hypothetical protein
MTAAHSYWSASKFESLMLCPGKIVLEDGAPDNTNAYAAEGTAAHQVLTWALQEERPASAYIGRQVHLDKRGKPCELVDGAHWGVEYTFEVDQDMAEHVQTCIDYCLDLKGDDGVLFADIRVNYSSYLDVEHDTAWGTADVIIARGNELIVVDFKYGRGVEVDAEKNPQMSLYGLGALQGYQGLCGDFERVRLAISQPRVKSAPSEWDCSVEELETWGRGEARDAVTTCQAAVERAPVMGDGGFALSYLRPTEKACKFCKAKATCPALRDEVSETVGAGSDGSIAGDFEDLTTVTMPSAKTADIWLSICLEKADLIEDWVKAVRAEVERRLLAGDKVPGFKVVQGKKGNRQWRDAKEAEELLKTMRVPIDKMYDMTVISPTSAEKLAPKYDKNGKLVPPKDGAPAPTIGPRQWPKLKELIKQNEGKPHVAPESDSRPALVITPAIDDFTDVTTADDLA